MNAYNLSFIKEEELYLHVRNTIKAYGESLNRITLHDLNKNIIDPIKLIFDKYVYGESWSEIVSHEVFRQRDKSNNNAIGYFH